METTLPFVLLGDEAFPLKENLLRLYPGKNLTEGQLNFNFRLSRARRVVENAFGILAARFGVFRRPMLVKAELIVKAATVLHNFLREDIIQANRTQTGTSRELPIVDEVTCEGNIKDTTLLHRIPGRCTAKAKAIKKRFREYSSKFAVSEATQR